MSEPKIADKRPAVLQLEPGTYYWCACGHSEKQPYCDGHHKGTDFVPLKFEITESGQKALCQCKASGTKPFCDGTHQKL